MFSNLRWRDRLISSLPELIQLNHKNPGLVRRTLEKEFNQTEVNKVRNEVLFRYAVIDLPVNVCPVMGLFRMTCRSVPTVVVLFKICFPLVRVFCSSSAAMHKF